MVELAYVVHGPRDAPAVVLVHGFPYDRAMWRFQIGPLTRAGYRVILPDLPGHGRSDVEPNLSVDSMADDIARLLDRLHLPKAVIVGFSLGGYVALAFAARHAQRMAGLVLMDTRAAADTEEGRTKRDAAIADVQGHGTRGIVAAMLPKHLTAATRSTQRLLAEEVRDMMLRQEKAGVLAALAALRDRPDRTGILASIQVPTLVMVGSDDALTPPADAELLAAKIPGATLRVVQAAAHLTPMEQPDDVNDALLEWLARAAPTSA